MGGDKAAASGSPALRFEHVSKAFGPTQALDDVSFAVRRGAVHALLGGNGSGKSTLIKILAGVYSADAGTVVVDGNEHEASAVTPNWAHDVGLRFVHQAVGTFPDMTVAENFALGSTFGTRGLKRVPWRTLRAHVAAVLRRFELDVDPSAHMRDLSPATQTMVAVARALQDEDSSGRGLLVLDEPTASLPASEVDLLLDAVRGWVGGGHTVMLVTHRLDEVTAVATDVTFLRDGKHLETGPLEGIDERAMVRRIAGMDQVAVPREGRPQSAVRMRATELRGGALQGVDLTVRAGEVVGLSGLLGSGRTTLLRTLFGAQSPDDGAIELDGEPFLAKHPAEGMRAGVAYLPEDRQAEAAFNDLPIRDNLSIVAPARHFNGFRIRRDREERDATEAIARHGVVAPGPLADLSSLSGGNQQKVVLARWLATEPRVLLLDEPTQGVDVGARAAIHAEIRAAADRGTAVVVATSDAKELAELCDRVVGLVAGTVRGEISGDELTAERCLELAHGLPATASEKSHEVRSEA